MSAASALAAAKANLVTNLQTLWTAQSATPVLVTYGPTDDYDPDDIVEILDATFVDVENAPMSPLRNRNFDFTITGLITCYRGGGIEVQQLVTERALTLLGNASDWLQDSGNLPSTHINLGGAVLWARVSSAEIHEADGENDDEDLSAGRTTVIAFVISGRIRA